MIMFFSMMMIEKSVDVLKQFAPSLYRFSLSISTAIIILWRKFLSSSKSCSFMGFQHYHIIALTAAQYLLYFNSFSALFVSRIVCVCEPSRLFLGEILWGYLVFCLLTFKHTSNSWLTVKSSLPAITTQHTQRLIESLSFEFRSARLAVVLHGYNKHSNNQWEFINNV